MGPLSVWRPRAGIIRDYLCFITHVRTWLTNRRMSCRNDRYFFVPDAVGSLVADLDRIVWDDISRASNLACLRRLLLLMSVLVVHCHHLFAKAGLCVTCLRLFPPLFFQILLAIDSLWKWLSSRLQLSGILEPLLNTLGAADAVGSSSAVVSDTIILRFSLSYHSLSRYHWHALKSKTFEQMKETEITVGEQYFCK